jgi:hypothetical protein
MAVRRPAAAVPSATASIAADLLFEAQRFMGTRRGLPDVAADVGGLAAQLGRALAGLDAFEAVHTAWHPELKCFAWRLRDPLPVKRLRQQTATFRTVKEQRESDGMRTGFRKLLVARIETAYEEGYRDAAEGRPRGSAFPASISSELTRRSS